jgi:hypothetical protein
VRIIATVFLPGGQNAWKDSTPAPDGAGSIADGRQRFVARPGTPNVERHRHLPQATDDHEDGGCVGVARRPYVEMVESR